MVKSVLLHCECEELQELLVQRHNICITLKKRERNTHTYRGQFMYLRKSKMAATEYFDYSPALRRQPATELAYTPRLESRGGLYHAIVNGGVCTGLTETCPQVRLWSSWRLMDVICQAKSSPIISQLSLVYYNRLYEALLRQVCVRVSFTLYVVLLYQAMIRLASAQFVSINSILTFQSPS